MKNKILLCLSSLMLGGGLSVYAQDKKELPLTDEESDVVYVAVQVKANYAGGMGKFNEDFKSRFVIPEEMIDEGGPYKQVILIFIVERDGELTDIRVGRDPGQGVGNEAMRVIKEMPKWKPAVQNSKAVRSQVTLPITLTKQLSANFFVDEKDVVGEPQYIGRAYWTAGDEDFIKRFRKAYASTAKTYEARKSFLLHFVVELDGTLSNVEAYDKTTNQQNQDVSDLIQQIGKWNPGRVNNKAVRSKIQIEVSL